METFHLSLHCRESLQSRQSKWNSRREPWANLAIRIDGRDSLKERPERSKSARRLRTSASGGSPGRHVLAILFQN